MEDKRKEKEREGREEGKMRRGRRGGEKMRGIVIGGMVIGLLLGCNNGAIEELEKKSSFYESVMKIGHEFQEIFGIFGSAMGEALGFNAVKSDSKKSEVGEHFKKIKKGLENTNEKLKKLSDDISDSKNTDGSTITAVKGAIKDASDSFSTIIGALSKLVDVTNDNSTEIGASQNSTDAVPADSGDVHTVIDNVNTIVELANKSGLEIKSGDAGSPVTASAQTDATAVLGGQAQAQAGPKFAEIVSKTNAWAIIDKIKSSKTKSGTAAANDDTPGELVTGTKAHNNGASAKTNADFTASVALKAMIKKGQFSAVTNEAPAVKAAAASAVNKVLGALDEIIRRTVAKNLEKVREAVNKIQYSDTPETESTEAKK